MQGKRLVKKVDYLEPEIVNNTRTSFQLEYYVTESRLSVEPDIGDTTVYGIEIVKTSDSKICENIVFNNVFCSRESAEGFADLIARNTVTPVSLEYIIQDTLGV